MADPKTPEYEPPQACVNRMIKSVLPNNVQITKDSRAAFARAAGIFIFYLSSCANDFSRERKRQTIFPADVMSALTELDMGEFVGDVEKFLEEMKSKDGPANKKARLGGDGDGDDAEINKSIDSANSGDANDDGDEQQGDEEDVDGDIDVDVVEEEEVEEEEGEEDA